MMATERAFMIVGCLLLASAGSLSAYGFHGLQASPEAIAAWEWAVQMQYYHSLGLVLVSLLGAYFGASLWLRGSGALMLAGMLIFSGLIYAENFGAPASLGQAVPTGGLCLMLSWLLAAIGVWRAQR